MNRLKKIIINFLQFLAGVVFFILKPLMILYLFYLLLQVALKSRKHRKIPTYFKKEARQKIVYRLFKAALAIYNVKIKTFGKDNIVNGSSLIVANHKSNADSLALFCAFYKNSDKNASLTFVAKKELEEKKIIRSVISLLDGHYLDRSSPREGLVTIEAMAKTLRNGVSVVIFPEGTRVKEENTFGDFKAASLKPAYQTYKPITPVAIVKTSKIMTGNKWQFISPFRKKVVISFLKSYEANEFSTISSEILMKKISAEIILDYNNREKDI